ncbi:MAG: endopeptidase La [Epsilonproteobacteria bacterium]|nr:endopeptidase La [Campylobacterota bacterium]
MKLENYDAFPMELLVLKQENIIYPFMIVPIFISDPQEIQRIKQNQAKLLFVTTKEAKRAVGTIGTILREVELPDGKLKILFQGMAKGKIKEITKEHFAIVELLKVSKGNKLEIEALLDTLKDLITELSKIHPFFPKDLIKVIDSNNDGDRIVDLLLSSLKVDDDKSYKIFANSALKDRLLLLIKLVSSEIESAKIKNELAKKVSKNINDTNREYFLRQQLRMIQEELGLTENIDKEIEEYYTKLENLKPKMPTEAYKEIKKQLDRLVKLHPESSEYATTENYVDWALSVPFGKKSKTKLKISDLQKRLDKEHYGLQKPKERIIDYFAAKELVESRDKEYKGAIICFVGPPGVGKTSLANSIAKTLKRELVRIALGGIDDVSELRGHRRTYVGSMPGRIIQGLINAKSFNPVVVLDEIDKIARHRGDPTSVLLEILDPEQNTNFRDLYLNFDVDLSQVIFIATANDISLVPAPLRDRLELIFVDSYTPNEKFEIAWKYLITQELKRHALKKSEVNITPSALKKIIDEYTKEAGVRNLRKVIAKIMRKAAKEILQGAKKVSINVNNLEEYLKKGYGAIEQIDKEDRIGVVNGLAWTAVGGDLLKIEAIKLQGKGALTLTGSLGDVMKESAKIALSVVRVLIDEQKLPTPPSSDKEPYYKHYDTHIHFPAGATPKDGPSAGIAMVSVLSSIFSQTPIRHDIAMTGEVSLIGDVLPIGGLKEKLIAAYKAKVKTVLIPQKNYDRDLDEIPQEVKEGLEIVPVKRVEEVLKHALVTKKRIK